MTISEPKPPKSVFTAINDNFMAFASFLGNLPYSRIKDGPPLCVSTSTKIDDLNFVCGSRVSGPDIDAEIEKIKDFFTSQEEPFIWWVTPSTGSSKLGAKLSAHGFEYESDIPFMALELKNFEANKLNSGIVLKEVKTQKDLNIWHNISIIGFEIDKDECREYIRLVNSFDPNAHPNLKLYFALVDKEPAATSLIFTGSGVAGIYWISTVPNLRRRGIGKAITALTCVEAKKIGCNLATLQSTIMGQNMYASVGFKKYVDVPIYVFKLIPN